MVFRYSWLAGAAALLFVLYQLNGLLRPTVEGPPWQLIIVAALILGVAITWTALSYRVPTWLVVVINAVAAVIAVARVSAPETTFALLPTGNTLTRLDAQMAQAFETVRNGIEPVIPLAGLVVILLILFWAVGFLFAWGLSKGHPYVALLPPLVISLQFATMDRQSTGAIKAAIFVAIVAGVLLAITLDQRTHGTGRMVAVGEWARTPRRLSRSSGGLLAGIVGISVVTVTLFSNFVPADGVIDWRSPTGLTGDFYGSVSYNPFIGIKQSLVANSNTPVFAVRVIDGDIPADQLYFTLLTMETYSGGQFSATKPEVVPLEETGWVDPAQDFDGPTDSIIVDIEIQRLRMEWLPSAPFPQDFASTASIESAVRVRTDDGALRFEGGLTFEEMRYQVRSEIPRPDIAALAVGEDGQLSAAFRLAAEADETVPNPAATVVLRPDPPNVERYLELPDDLDGGIASLARQQTRNLETPFEKGIALESWFRSPAFRYSTDIQPGHGASDLASWLLDPDPETSANYRTGYCENFATAMAVMARTLGIPSRVVLGFTPGTAQSDGTIIVRDRNAHAWVELWMPTQGWVRFDPTPRGDRVNPTTYEEVETSLGFALTAYLDVPNPETIDTPALPPRIFEPALDEPVLPPFGGGGETDGGGFAFPGWTTSVLPWLSLGLLLFFGVPLVKWWRRRRRIRRLRTGDISAAWDEIVARLDDLGRPPSPADTPTEVAEKVDPAMSPLAAVYARSLYGATATLPEEHLDSARKSFKQTAERLTTRHSRWERIRANYRVNTLVPKWMKRRKRR